MKGRKLFNKEQADFIKKNIKGKTNKQFVKILKEKFNINITPLQLEKYKWNNGLKSGINPQFKKGHSVYSTKKIGSESIWRNNETFIKIDNNNGWKPKNRYLYEKYKGPIPKGYAVMFADGDKQNFDLDNLVLIKQKDLLTLKNQNLIFKDKELTKTGILIAQLINKTAERK